LSFVNNLIHFKFQFNLYRMIFEWKEKRGLYVPGHVTSPALVPVLRTLPATEYNNIQP